nr:hypothetical protein [Vibrio alginolyticus]
MPLFVFRSTLKRSRVKTLEVVDLKEKPSKCKPKPMPKGVNFNLHLARYAP